MSQCISIKFRNTPNYEVCDSFRVIAVGGSIGITFQPCGGGVTSSILVLEGEVKDICVVGNTGVTQSSGSGTMQATALGICATEDSAISDEPIYLDLPVDFDLRETKVLTELTEVDTLKFNYTLGFEIPNNPHNFNALKTYFNPNVLDNQYNGIQVDVLVGSHYVSESYLYVKKCDERSDSISVELRLSTDHWARKSKDLFLNRLPFDTITMNCAHVTEVIQNQYPYNNSQLGIWYPYVDYGNTLIRDWFETSVPDNVIPLINPIEYHRAWFYVAGLLEKGFCELGWAFESPIFQSNLGHRMLCYIFDRKFGLRGLYF